MTIGTKSIKAVIMSTTCQIVLSSEPFVLARKNALADSAIPKNAKTTERFEMSVSARRLAILFLDNSHCEIFFISAGSKVAFIVRLDEIATDLRGVIDAGLFVLRFSDAAL